MNTITTKIDQNTKEFGQMSIKQQVHDNRIKDLRKASESFGDKAKLEHLSSRFETFSEIESIK